MNGRATRDSAAKKLRLGVRHNESKRQEFSLNVIQPERPALLQSPLQAIRDWRYALSLVLSARDLRVACDDAAELFAEASAP